MNQSIRHKLIDVAKRAVAVFLCMAMALTMIGPWKAKAAGGVKRHIVLILDVSGESKFYHYNSNIPLYTASSPMDQVKEAAKKFIDSLASTDDDVYVSIITYADSAAPTWEFTNNYNMLSMTIDYITRRDTRKNMTAALALAKEQLDSVADEDSIKSVILVSPGMCDAGDYVIDGHWSTFDTGGNWVNRSTQIPFAHYSNAAYLNAVKIKATGAKIYGIGIMQMMENCPDSVKDPAQFFQNVLRDISSVGCYYPVYDVDDFTFAFGQMTKNVFSACTGKFFYSSTNKKSGDFSGTFFYEDNYFMTPATEYNASLATMSMCFAMTAFVSESRTPQYANAIDLLEKCGFEGIEANRYFKEEPNIDTMGVVIGYKNIATVDGEFTVIALATRGAGYGNEWAGNFKVGSSGNHYGFGKAKDLAKAFLDDYVAAHSRDFRGDVKLWMTGYSRAAATVNLLAGEITKAGKIGEANQISVSKENIYAYCFEPPKGLSSSVCSTAEARRYTNIHNIVNPNDFVPNVAMSGWGFLRYGVDEAVIPDVRTDASYRNRAAKMMAIYSEIGGREINASYVSLSDYENHLDEVFEGIVEKGKEEFLSGARSVSSFVQNALALDEWDDPNGAYQPTLKKDFLNGKEYSLVGGIVVYFRDCPGYGIFDNAYSYMQGLIEMRSICKTQSGLISKIDLFYVRDYRESLRNLIGILNLKNNIYDVDYSIKQGEAIRDVLSRLTAHISRGIYDGLVQSGVTAVLREYYSKNGAFSNVHFSDIDFIEAIGGKWTLIDLALSLLMSGNVIDNARKISKNFLDYLEDQGVNVDQGLTSTERQKFTSAIEVLLQAIARISGNITASNEILSLAYSTETIGMAHYPELCLSWLQSQDINYDSNSEASKWPTATRTVYINCPVDVEAKDSNGIVVASLVDELKQVTEGYVLSGITADGAKRMYLPTNEAYTVTITAREDCTMSFSINESDADDVCQYIENYYDIPMKKGDVVTVTLPQEFFVDDDGVVTIVEADNTLTTKQGTVEADVILRNEDASESVYTVTVENDNTAGGICYGGGEYVLGAYAMVSAAEYDDCEFLGWYEDNELITTEREYRFRVTCNRTLTARFAGETEYGHNGIFKATVVAEEGGYVDSDTITALDGCPFELTAIPDLDHEFDGWVADGNCIIANPSEPTTEVTLIDEDVTLTAKFKEPTGDGPVNPGDDPTHQGGDTITPIDGVTVTYRTDATWTGGYNGSITITNNSGREITDWGMTFDMNAPIAGFWNASITNAENGKYTIKDGGWNNRIAAGQSITIGFTATGYNMVSPTNFRVFERKPQTNNGSTAACTAEFKTTSSWNGGCVGELVITNTSNTALTNWRLTFTCSGHVNSVWNGRLLTQSGTTYTVGDDGSHPSIAPGAMIRIGINLNANGADAYPKDLSVSVN
jgi:Cellulose binding domain./von Willebrand factor type A domain.